MHQQRQCKPPGKCASALRQRFGGRVAFAACAHFCATVLAWRTPTSCKLFIFKYIYQRYYVRNSPSLILRWTRCCTLSSININVVFYAFFSVGTSYYWAKVYIYYFRKKSKNLIRKDVLSIPFSFALILCIP